MKEKIYDMIPFDRYITREELVNTLQISDRLVRLYIAEIRKEHNVISLSKGKGYMKPKHTDNMTKEEITEMHDIIQHQINENQSRIDNIKKSMKMQIAYLKQLEKHL